MTFAHGCECMFLLDDSSIAVWLTEGKRGLCQNQGGP